MDVGSLLSEGAVVNGGASSFSTGSGISSGLSFEGSFWPSSGSLPLDSIGSPCGSLLLPSGGFCPFCVAFSAVSGLLPILPSAPTFLPLSVSLPGS